ncbi:60S ribosomal protein L14-A-like protein [Cryphonectria parasitica EP155]|uniref:60S ribosomal protein L14-A-like protein n=1 Tax=Cryphonectria parasitica (strain ATCC 38755 / EP155) TaxID=660469 RepID=A0A9P5CT02_CRYP1|nr:60S ribosomal protein L14-A-like protein [Cryphonectria parasitica EP155]KAF3768650.1 60S ribosomal protein L14-A-like protein [Cryphonectria parasitica EP155]
MGDISIIATEWRTVQVGRVVVLQSGAEAGRLAAIVEIVDHKRALVDGPSSESALQVTRQMVSFSNVVLTDFVVAGLPRGARTPTVKKFWEKAEIDQKWKGSNWAKKRDQQAKRSTLTDFDRFKVLRLKKQRRFEERKALAKVKASA